jgi:hypothetical protein
LGRYRRADVVDGAGWIRMTLACNSTSLDLPLLVWLVPPSH